MSIPRRPAIDRLLDLCVQDGDCWIFTGALTSFGYSKIGRGGKRGGTASGHRVSYEFFVGPIPEGLTLDHLCRRPACVNFQHLDPVPIGVNVARGTGIDKARAVRLARATCPSGHPFDEANTRLTKEGARVCRTCARASTAAYRIRRKAVPA
jgi:hypothetical protein